MMIGGLEVEGQADTTVGVGATEVVVEGATPNHTEEEEATEVTVVTEVAEVVTSPEVGEEAVLTPGAG